MMDKVEKQRKEFQSTLPMRGATALRCGDWIADDISIHAPHAGSDAGRVYHESVFKISIHAPHAGSDLVTGK